MTGIERLAQEVMGWKLKKSRKNGWGSCSFGGVTYADLPNGNQCIIGGNGWNPEKNLLCAFEVAKRIGNLQLEQWEGKVWTARFRPLSCAIFGRGKTPEKAIYLAALAYLDSQVRAAQTL